MIPGADNERFSVAVQTVDGAVVLELSGELDHDTAQPLREALDAAVTQGGRLVVDLSGLGFCDSTGLNVLLHSRLSAQEAGGSLELTGLRGSVAGCSTSPARKGSSPYTPMWRKLWAERAVRPASPAEPSARHEAARSGRALAAPRHIDTEESASWRNGGHLTGPGTWYWTGPPMS